MSELEREVTLQAQEITDSHTQFKVVVPSEFVRLAEWKKGDTLKMTFVLGSGKLIIERDEEGD